MFLFEDTWTVDLVKASPTRSGAETVSMFNFLQKNRVIFFFMTEACNLPHGYRR
jgi:hypothetical protein